MQTVTCLLSSLAGSVSLSLKLYNYYTQDTEPNYNNYYIARKCVGKRELEVQDI